MDEDNIMELFIQNGVLLTSGPAAYMSYCNTTGTLCIIEYLNSNKVRFIEWKPNDITIDSDGQEQEWALVNTIERRRTLSSSLPQESSNRSKYLKINMTEIRSFRSNRTSQKLIVFDGQGDQMCSFSFQHGTCDTFVSVLRGLLKTTASKRDKLLNIVLDDTDDPDTQRLDKSFAQLNLFQEQEPSYVVTRFLKNIQSRPYETTMEAFSKLTDYVLYRPPDETYMDELNKSLTAIDNSTTTHTQDEYEMVAHVPRLPERKDFPRGTPLTINQWRALHDHEERIEDVEAVKLVIFRGGIEPHLRKEIWKYLLGYVPWDSTHSERQQIMKHRNEEYFSMKLQWKTMTKPQEDNFADFRERKSLIEKDVNRTDRTLLYFAGDNNPNLQVLYDILMTYVMYNFDLGYVQGMSDLLSPILFLLDNEVDAFWCFVGFMNKVDSNFDIDQAGMKEQLLHLHTLLALVDPELTNYFDKHDSGNMFFCFRWLLVWFKRELSLTSTMALWEVLWTDLPCQNFHLLICVAILDTEKQVFFENHYGFNEILKHINDLSGCINLPEIICKAEGIYHQIVEASHLTDSVRLILGLPILGNTLVLDSKETSPEDSAELSTEPPCSLETVSFGNDEVTFERSINSSYL